MWKEPLLFFKDDTPHSKIGASSMYRWSACPGSVQMSQFAAKGESSVYAMEGTVAHEVAAFYLTHGFWPLPDDYDMTINQMTAMVKDLSVYTDYCKRIELNEPNNTNFIEHGFDIGDVYPGAFGTADFVSYNPDEKTIKVADLKFGRGLVVEVENNPQLLYYAFGAVHSLKLPFAVVELVVIQPRAFHPKGHIRNWRIGVEEMLDFRADFLEAAKRTEAKNPHFEAGKHCFFCSAIDICPKSEEAKKAKSATPMKPQFASDPKKDFEPVEVEDVNKGLFS